MWDSGDGPHHIPIPGLAERLPVNLTLNGKRRKVILHAAQIVAKATVGAVLQPGGWKMIAARKGEGGEGEGEENNVR